jgi:cytochrome c peroxidase
MTTEPWDEQRLQGAVLFHNTRDTRMTANRWISCAVCHLEGGLVSDGLVWDLTVAGDPPKVSNTMDLVLTPGTAPPFFHRGTPHFEPAEERFVRVFASGTGFLRESEPGPAAAAGHAGSRQSGSENGPGISEAWQAVLAYINSLRPRPNPHMAGNVPRAEIREAAQRGRKIFFDDQVGCAHCHGGPHLTISGNVARANLFDVGTGQRLDVPSLLNLWETAPYLHDGRAKTLHDVLTTCNPDDKHGKTAHLTAQEIADLISFLLAPYEEKQR